MGALGHEQAHGSVTLKLQRERPAKLQRRGQQHGRGDGLAKQLSYRLRVVLVCAQLAPRALEAYFASSEQLPTRVLLAADEERGAGVLVQKVPGSADESDMQQIWEDAQRGIERLSADELLQCPVEELLVRSFAAHDMRLFRGSPVQFQCRCSQGRVAGLLRALGPDEIRGVVREQGAVTVTCEFCHRPYRFDAVDVEALFADAADSNSPPSIH